MIVIHPEQVVAARQGDRAALEALVRAAQRPVYNVALRMLADPAAAEDATQEILIKMITNLGSLRDPAAAGGWVLRIACRHLVGLRKQSRTEAMRLTFGGFAEDLDHGQALLSAAGLTQIEEKIAVAQVKTKCTLALLTCLSRKLRAAYILGEIFEMDDGDAARALEITPPAFRQRLSRARVAVLNFTLAQCGITSPRARCHCSRRVVPALTQGRIESALDTGEAAMDIEKLQKRIRNLEDGRAAAALMRSNPDFEIEVLPRLLQSLASDLGPASGPSS